MTVFHDIKSAKEKMLGTHQYSSNGVWHFATIQKRCSFCTASYITRWQGVFKLPFDEIFLKK